MVSWIILCFCLPGVILAGYPPSNSNCCPNKYPFLPAPPGKTPPCAKYGATFCEKIDTYPTDVIRYLLYKWGRTYEQFIRSETDRDFFLVSQTYNGYGPPSYGGYDSYEQSSYHPNYNYTGGGYAEPAIDPNAYYGESPPQPLQQKPQQHQHQHQQQQPSQQSYQTNPPPPNYQNPNTYQQPSHSHYNQPQQQQQQQQNTQQSYQYVAAAVPPIVHSYWWNHRESNNNNNEGNYPYLAQHRRRARRQAADADQMCDIRNSYITPKAAMNGDGNWMYVVNMEEDKRYVQQVKTEACISPGGPCRNVCSFPPGYRASCRQKYVQKRLVALAGTGDRLMTDVFWFPHCCICQFSTT